MIITYSDLMTGPWSASPFSRSLSSVSLTPPVTNKRSNMSEQIKQRRTKEKKKVMKKERKKNGKKKENGRKKQRKMGKQIIKK